MRALVFSLLLALQGCGAQCFDCRDPACPCASGQTCTETDVLPASTSPGAMHYTAWVCREARK